MSTTSESNICNVLRETWRSIITLVDYLKSFLRKILSQIQALISRIKNTIIRRLLSTIRSLQEIIQNFLGLQTLDSNSARSSFCSILYACKPAVETISQFVSPELFSKIFGKESIKTINLSDYGISPLNFNSKFELFEYVACRLSLTGLLDSVVSNFINQLMSFLSQFDKYFDINWWLENTVWGRVLKRLINEYESIFNDRIKPFLDKLIPYLNCTFALCDFSVSTNNYLDDFQAKFKAERSQTAPDVFEFKIVKEELYSDLTDSMNSAQAEMVTFKEMLAGPVEASKPLFHNTAKGESVKSDAIVDKTSDDPQKLPYNSTESSVIKNNLMNRTSSLTPGIRDGSPIPLRRTVVMYSPNSKD